MVAIKEETDRDIEQINNIGEKSTTYIHVIDKLGYVKPYMHRLNIEGKEINFEIDTGVCYTIINEGEYELLCKHNPTMFNKLCQEEVKLSSYTDGILDVKGILEVTVTLNNVVIILPLVVVGGKGNNLLGRNWLEKIRLD